MTQAIETEAFELTPDQLDEAVGGLVKIGTGTLVLSSANTYAGTTAVEHGIIAI